MGRKRFTPKQIMNMPQDAEVLLDQDVHIHFESFNNKLKRFCGECLLIMIL